MKQLNVRIPDELDAALTHIAKATGRSKSFYMKEALLRQLEDMQDIVDADIIWRRVQSGEEKLHDFKEVMARLDLED